MFTMKYEPNKWMMTVRFNTGGIKRGEWDHFDPIHVERYGPFDTQEEAWMLYYALKAEDEYGTIKPYPFFEEIAAPPALSVEQKFAAAKHVMRDPQREYWKPQHVPFPELTKEQLEHQADISNYILESAANDIAHNWTKHSRYCVCDTCYMRQFNNWRPN